MANDKEKTDNERKQIDRLAELLFPNLSSIILVEKALEFEKSLN